VECRAKCTAVLTFVLRIYLSGGSPLLWTRFKSFIRHAGPWEIPMMAFLVIVLCRTRRRALAEVSASSPMDSSLGGTTSGGRLTRHSKSTYDIKPQILE
jgi:hypothetical protein